LTPEQDLFELKATPSLPSPTRLVKASELEEQQWLDLGKERTIRRFPSSRDKKETWETQEESVYKLLGAETKTTSRQSFGTAITASARLGFLIQSRLS
jgi:hypothetical protein